LDLLFSANAGILWPVCRFSYERSSTLENVDKLYPKLTEAVRKDHIEFDMVATGHDFDHTLQVKQTARVIAPDEYTGWIASAAAICHNADRLLEKRRGDVGRKKVPECEVVAMVLRWLNAGETFSEQEIVIILRAVQKHSGPNLADGDLVLMTLQDADRVVCSMPDVIMCATQFRPDLRAIHPKWLTCDPNNPTNPYRDPQSVLHSMECWYDWADPNNSKFCVRLPRARVLMEENVAFLRMYIERIKTQRAKIDLYPDYPVETA